MRRRQRKARMAPIIVAGGVMEYSTLLYDVKDHVARITLNRPGAANALNAEMGHDLMLASIRAGEDKSVRAVILTGAGKMFCGGGDLKHFATQGERLPAHLKQLAGELHLAISRFARMGAPGIAAVECPAGRAGPQVGALAAHVVGP